MKHILSYVRRAVEDYSMIEENDKIAVALSGGKDSITLLKALKNLQIFYPKKFELIAISVNPGFESFNTKLLQNLCNDLHIPFFEEKYDIYEIVFKNRKEKNPCSLCANLRRGILNSVAKREHCTKIALGHNLDDVLETFLMNLFFTGTLSTFPPISYMDRSDITTIRPLIYVPEKETKRFIRHNTIEVMQKVCPMDGKSTREFIKNIIITLAIKYPYVKNTLLGCIQRNTINGWKNTKKEMEP